MMDAVDERAPGVGPAMRRRIASALDAGQRPTLRGNNLRLGSIVLQRTDGRDAPALAEVAIQMRRRGIDTAGAFDTFPAATPVRRGHSTYATDALGVEHRLTRSANGQNVPTPAGRRFYRQSFTRWLIHLPTCMQRRSTGARFNFDRNDLTGEDIGIPEEAMRAFGGSEAQQRQVVRDAVNAFLATHGMNLSPFIYDGDDEIDIMYDSTREPEFSIQTSGLRDGTVEADTLLDRVVWGEPIFPEDMWQLCHLHEVSRRRSGECSLDVIVASAQQRVYNPPYRKPIMTSDEAAKALVKLAREMDPEGALAQTTFRDVPMTDEVCGIDNDLRERKPDVSTLKVFLPGMRAFLNKPRTVAEIQKAAEKQHIWRKPHKVETSFAQAVRAAFPWTTTPRVRLLLFLRSMDIHVNGEDVSLEPPIEGAVEAVKECGTPVHLLVAYYQRLKCRLVLINGSRCARIWEPEDWASRDRNQQISVVLNVWSHHVSTYNPEASRAYLVEKDAKKWYPIRLLQRKADDEDHRYDEMVELDWDLLMEAIQEQRSEIQTKEAEARKKKQPKEAKDQKCAEKKQGVVFWTTDTKEELESGLKAHDLAFIPHYSAPGRCNGIDIPFNAGKHKSSVRIKIVPENHRELRDFCQKVQDELKLKLYYKGESAGVLGHNFLKEFLIRKREAIPKAKVKELREKQQDKCAKCHDMLRRWEIHHDPPVAEGGTSDDIVLVCPTCHAEETEKQELKGDTTPQYFESQLSPDMMDAFRTLPMPRQLRYGDPVLKEKAMASDGFVELDCLDIVGCRKNALLEREYLPVGTPFDCMRSVFNPDGSYNYYSLTDYAWLWVEAEGEHALYQGPQLYPLETVQVLMDEGFLVASADTLPFGWKPWREFPSSDLADAWANMERCGGDKKMILATIGLWNKQERRSWYVRKTDCEQDMPGPVVVKTFRQDGTSMMCSTILHDNVTMLPISLLCLFDEARRMHKARQLVARVPGIIPLGCQVDGLFYVGPAKAKLELRRLCDQEKYAHSLTNVFQFKDATWKQVPTCKQKCGTGRECHRPTPNNERPWNQLEEGKDDAPFREHLINQCGQEDFEAMCKKVHDVNPRLDTFQIFAVLAAVSNGSALVLGAAGTGKSEVLRTIRKMLDTRVIAYTHAATRLVGGDTVAHTLYLNTQLTDNTILVDEVGLIPLSTIGAMSKWMALGANFICFGDYQGQFEPFRDRWNLPLPFEISPLMHELCGGLKIKLTKYRRGVDPELFSWYHGMYGQEDVRGLVAESRERYPAACDRGCKSTNGPLVLCVSHRKRMKINERQNEFLKPEGALHCDWTGDDPVGCTMLPQSMWVWKGLELIGCSRGSGKKLVVQGVVYVITDITETHCHLQMREEYCTAEKGDEKVEIEIQDMCSQLRLTHAMCYYTIQGRTIKNRDIVLLDTNHPHFTVRSLIVALSRVEDSKYLHIGDCNSEAMFVGERKVRQRVQRRNETAC